MPKNMSNLLSPIGLALFYPDVKAHVYATLNMMGEKRLSANIEYVSYFNAILYYAESGLDAEKFEVWQSTLDKVLNIKQKKRAKDFLKFSEYFFKDKSNICGISNSLVYHLEKPLIEILKLHIPKSPFFIFQTRI